MTLGRKIVHEKYHKSTTSQYKIIKGNNFTYRHLIKFINRYLQEGDKILDIGCGAGTLDFYFASKGYRITGIDISKNAIGACNATKKNLGFKNLEFIVGDFQKTKLKGKFDFVIFTEVIEHLPDDNLALKKIHSLLKPNGILFLTTPSSSAPMYRMGLAYEFDKKVGHLRRYNKYEIKNLVKDSNFKIIETIENEGILRNFLFLNVYASKSIRLYKFFVSDIITFADNLSLKLLGESNYFIIARKK